MLGDNIKKIRKEKGISINKLSKLSKISLGYLSDLENNNAKNPTMDKLNSIATSLDISVNDLLSDKEKIDIVMTSMNKIKEMAQDGLKNSNKATNCTSIDMAVSEFTNVEFTENEQEEISNFIKYVLSKRKNK